MCFRLVNASDTTSIITTIIVAIDVAKPHQIEPIDSLARKQAIAIRSRSLCVYTILHNVNGYTTFRTDIIQFLDASKLHAVFLLSCSCL